MANIESTPTARVGDTNVSIAATGDSIEVATQLASWQSSVRTSLTSPSPRVKHAPHTTTAVEHAEVATSPIALGDSSASREADVALAQRRAAHAAAQLLEIQALSRLVGIRLLLDPGALARDATSAWQAEEGWCQSDLARTLQSSPGSPVSPEIHLTSV